jgi:hypothetical protein
VNHVRSAARLFIVVLATAGCSLLRNRDVDNCASFAVRPDSAFDSTSASGLVGRYQLIMISESANEFSHSVRGPLELFAVSGAAGASGPTTSADRRAGSSLLWGTAQLPPKGIAIPWTYDPSSRDPNRPGLLLHANGDIDLGGRRDNGAPGVSMHIESVSRNGFGGTWTGLPDTALPINAKGDPLPAPHGRFCALRR